MSSETESNARYKKISKSIRAELDSIPPKTIKQVFYTIIQSYYVQSCTNNLFLWTICSSCKNIFRSSIKTLSNTFSFQFEKDIYSTVSDMGYKSVVVMATATKTERIAIVAISQYCRLKCTSHLPISVVEVIYKPNK